MRKDKLIADLVRAFFKNFTRGIIERHGKSMETVEPKYLKQIMLDYYELISKVYNREMPYVFAIINYNEEEAEERIRAFVKQNGTLDEIAFIRFACRTEDFFNTMVEEYKRNFMLLLEGRLADEEEHETLYCKNKNLGSIDHLLAEELISRISKQSYNAAKALFDNQF